MMRFRSLNAMVVIALFGLTVPPPLEAETLEQRVKDLERRVAALEDKIKTCQCGSATTEVSWETNDINDVVRTASKTLPFAPKSAVVTLFEIRNIGGVGGHQPIFPERTVTLLQGASGDIPMSECFVFGAPGGIWQLKLSSSTLTMTSLKCGYPKGFRGAFKIVLTP